MGKTTCGLLVKSSRPRGCTGEVLEHGVRVVLLMWKGIFTPYIVSIDSCDIIDIVWCFLGKYLYVCRYGEC